MPVFAMYIWGKCGKKVIPTFYVD